jgi:hypothetical protein
MIIGNRLDNATDRLRREDGSRKASRADALVWGSGLRRRGRLRGPEAAKQFAAFAQNREAFGADGGYQDCRCIGDDEGGRDNRDSMEPEGSAENEPDHCNRQARGDEERDLKVA